MKHTYEVTGLKCGSCATKITNALNKLEHVTGVEVTLQPPTAIVSMNAHLTTEMLNDALKGIGNYSLKERVEKPAAETQASRTSLLPLFVVIGYVIGGVLLIGYQQGDLRLYALMRNFMGGFFLALSLFKMIDLSGFADGYATYDILAKRSRAYALSYPFIELGLAILYFTDYAPMLTNGLTAVLMFIGSIGVGKALLDKKAIQCACLGTALKLPMTKITFAEDFAMGIMALAMLVF